MKVLMFYEVAPEGMAKALENYPAHRAAAEQFIKGDPFVANGVVGKWSLKDWNEVLG